MTLWWGEPWPSATFRASVCEDDALRVSVPVGYECSLCEELIESYDRGISMMGLGADGKAYPVQMHIECNCRNLMGCYSSLVSDHHDHDVPYREDARRVWTWIQEH